PPASVPAPILDSTCVYEIALLLPFIAALGFAGVAVPPMDTGGAHLHAVAQCHECAGAPSRGLTRDGRQGVELTFTGI
ncbi:MAG: hypothetical protein Q8N47_12130, partial [Bryobacterales bacterium]|nr:hypothetical protein [Bryobacterales bacterium]